jgi:hypothetical protein
MKEPLPNSHIFQITRRAANYLKADQLLASGWNSGGPWFVAKNWPIIGCSYHLKRINAQSGGRWRAGSPVTYRQVSYLPEWRRLSCK